MQKSFSLVVACTALVGALVLGGGSNMPVARACCGGGPKPPTPSELEFIAAVHREGLRGVNATQEISADGYPVQIGNWPGLGVGDSNILYAGYAICTGLMPGGPSSFSYWKDIYWKLGEPIDPADQYHPKIAHVTQAAQANLCPGNGR